MSESSGNRSHGQGSGDGGGGGGFGPVLSSTPSSICSPGSDLHTQVSNRADNNRIVVTFTNYGYLDLAYNFVAHLEKCSVSNYICVALDDKAYDALKSKNIPTYLLEMEKKLFNEDSHNFGSVGFIDICNLKPWLVLQIMKGGFDVVWTDTDIVWLHDAQRFFDRASPLVDMQVQSDDDDVCAGFFYVKTNPRTISFLESVIEYLNPLIDDQTGLRRFLQDERYALRLSEGVEDHYLKVKHDALRWWLDEIDERLPFTAVSTSSTFTGSIPEDKLQQANESESKKKINYIVLDRVLFPNGTAYFNAKLPQKLGVTPIVIHNNCIIGHDPKRLRFQMYGLWITTPTLTQKEQSALPITAPGETSEPLHVYKGHTEIVISIAINGDHLYTSGYDKTIKVWNRTQHKLTKVMYLNKRGGLWDIRVDAASNTCYSCSHDKSLQVWDMTKDPWECVGTMRGHWGVINAIELHEGILYSAADDMTVRSWNLETKERIMIYRGASDVVSAIVVDNGALFAASRDNAIRAWELKSGRVLQVYAGHSSWVRCIAVNSFKLYSGSNDGTVKEWDVKTGDCLRTFSGHTGAVSCMQRKGNLLYTGSDDGTVRVWNIDSPAEFGHCVHIYKGHEGMISCLKLHEDLLYTGSYDRTVRVYKNVQ